MTLNGMPVITSLWMTEPKLMKVSEPAGRTGWMKRVMRTIQVPRRDALVMGDKILIHPAALPELLALLSEPQQPAAPAPREEGR